MSDAKYICKAPVGLGNCEKDELCMQISDLELELSDLKKEEAASHKLINRQSDLLTGVANALRGQPDELSLHSHHDLPERAMGLMRQLAELQIRANNSQQKSCIQINRLERQLAELQKWNTRHRKQRDKALLELATLRKAAQELVANVEWDTDISSVDTGDLKALQVALKEKEK